MIRTTVTANINKIPVTTMIGRSVTKSDTSSLAPAMEKNKNGYILISNLLLIFSNTVY